MDSQVAHLIWIFLTVSTSISWLKMSPNTLKIVLKVCQRVNCRNRNLSGEVFDTVWAFYIELFSTLLLDKWLERWAKRPPHLSNCCYLIESGELIFIYIIHFLLHFLPLFLPLPAVKIDLCGIFAGTTREKNV